MLAFFMVFCGFYVYCMFQDHLLSVLLSLEFMVLGVFLGLQFLISMYYIYSLFYLLLAACEGALGLCVLISMSRSHGGDYLKTFNFY